MGGRVCVDMTVIYYVDEKEWFKRIIISQNGIEYKWSTINH